MSSRPRTGRPSHGGRAAREPLPALAIRGPLEEELSASFRSRGGVHSDDAVERWVARQRGAATLQVNIVPLDKLRGWGWEVETDNFVHQAGRFFSVIGLDVRQRSGLQELAWNQPIIEQPEVGILGIVAKKIGGVLHVCLQAKEEPGNIGGVQLSPTVQATFSNYTRAHQGAEPIFLSLFTRAAPGSIVFSRLQTEDGSRFLYKSNRNMVVLAGDDVPVALPDHFIWLTLRQVAGLLRRDNLVNACARSILAALSGCRGRAVRPTSPSSPAGAGSAGTIRETLQWLDDMRSGDHLKVMRIGLSSLGEWERDGKGYFSHREGRFFRLVGLRVSCESREVRSWDQPIIENASRGIIGLLVRERGGEREFLMQARSETGNRPSVQVAPTVQFTPGNYCGNRKLPLPYLFDEFSRPGRFPVLAETLQTEEGARFFRECHTHRVLALPEAVDLVPPLGYRWLPEAHVLFLLHLGEQVNSCARSIIGCLV